MMLSVVVPIYNERENIKPMIEALKSNLNKYDYEIIFVDDGSIDGTIEEVESHLDQKTKLIQLSRNFGQTSAMAAGIASANGEYIVTLDGDLQNDPSDIPMMLDKLITNKVDMVAGRRANRRDGALLRKFPSKVANFIIRKISGVDLKDYGCTLKVFKRDLAVKLDLYGELHRFIPILAHMKGGKILEVDVKHHSRQFGKSKYGIGRTMKVVSDLFLMMFMLKYRQKPMHLFGTLGVGSLSISFLIAIYLFFLKIIGQSITDKPLFYLFIILVIASLQLITTGFLAELVMRTYYESQNKKPYEIARKLGKFDNDA
ncbi:MAG: glycosyltransferase family 2 protein [Sphingobacteriia bacterium]|nr:glycosyltransferase family 2 protein [Sphingobacteriia bacterium]